eukprot:scaffold92704_cov23-Tisochrysis_lutea.AAC.1
MHTHSHPGAALQATLTTSRPGSAAGAGGGAGGTCTACTAHSPSSWRIVEKARWVWRGPSLPSAWESEEGCSANFAAVFWVGKVRAEDILRSPCEQPTYQKHHCHCTARFCSLPSQHTMVHLHILPSLNDSAGEGGGGAGARAAAAAAVAAAAAAAAAARAAAESAPPATRTAASAVAGGSTGSGEGHGSGDVAEVPEEEMPAAAAAAAGNGSKREGTPHAAEPHSEELRPLPATTPLCLSGHCSPLPEGK